MMNFKIFPLLLACFAVAVSSTEHDPKYDPIFTNAKQDEQSGDYTVTHGSRITCEFNFEPLSFTQLDSFKSQSSIDSNSDKFNMKQFVLQLKKVGEKADRSLQEQVLSRFDTVISFGRDYGKFTEVSGSLDIDTSSLDSTSVYKCCLEFADKPESSGLCSFLKFNSQQVTPAKTITSDEFFGKETEKQHIFKMTREFGESQIQLSQTVQQTVRVYKLARDMLLVFVIVITFAVLIGIVAWKVAEMKRFALVRKHQQLMGAAGGNAGSNGCYKISMPPLHGASSNTPGLYDELYVKYNLNSSLQIDCNEFPPAYDQIDESEMNIDNVRAPRKF